VGSHTRVNQVVGELHEGDIKREVAKGWELTQGGSGKETPGKVGRGIMGTERRQGGTGIKKRVIQGSPADRCEDGEN